jgi:septal ring factor EnvC (AmiA/AmiB activator)
MTFKTAAKKTGSGFLTALTFVADATNINRMNEIDAEMAPLQQRLDELQKERDQLEARLIY